MNLHWKNQVSFQMHSDFSEVLVFIRAQFGSLSNSRRLISPSCRMYIDPLALVITLNRTSKPLYRSKMKSHKLCKLDYCTSINRQWLHQQASARLSYIKYHSFSSIRKNLSSDKVCLMYSTLTCNLHEFPQRSPIRVDSHLLDRINFTRTSNLVCVCRVYLSSSSHDP